MTASSPRPDLRLLLGGTAAMVSAMFFEPRPEVSVVQGMPPQVIMLEEVVITGKRAASDSTANDTPTRTGQASQLPRAAAC